MKQGKNCRCGIPWNFEFMFHRMPFSCWLSHDFVFIGIKQSAQHLTLSIADERSSEAAKFFGENR